MPALKVSLPQLQCLTNNGTLAALNISSLSQPSNTNFEVYRSVTTIALPDPTTLEFASTAYISWMSDFVWVVLKWICTLYISWWCWIWAGRVTPMHYNAVSQRTVHNQQPLYQPLDTTHPKKIKVSDTPTMTLDQRGISKMAHWISSRKMREETETQQLKPLPIGKAAGQCCL
jgi:hypothetical protein